MQTQPDSVQSHNIQWRRQSSAHNEALIIKDGGIERKFIRGHLIEGGHLFKKIVFKGVLNQGNMLKKSDFM